MPMHIFPGIIHIYSILVRSNVIYFIPSAVVPPSSAAPLLSLERRWLQVLTDVCAARIPECSCRLLVHDEVLVPPAHPQYALLRAEISNTAPHAWRLAPRSGHDAAARPRAPLTGISPSVFECNRIGSGEMDLARAHLSRHRTHIQLTRVIYKNHIHQRSVVPASPRTVDAARPNLETLELASTAIHSMPGCPEPPVRVQGRSGVRCTSRTHTAQTTASFTDWRQITPRWRPILVPWAQSTALTEPGPTTDPLRCRRVAMVPRPAQEPNIPRLCRFPGREASFVRAQRGLCTPIIKRCGL